MILKLGSSEQFGSHKLDLKNFKKKFEILFYLFLGKKKRLLNIFSAIQQITNPQIHLFEKFHQIVSTPLLDLHLSQYVLKG